MHPRTPKALERLRLIDEGFQRNEAIRIFSHFKEKEGIDRLFLAGEWLMLTNFEPANEIRFPISSEFISELESVLFWERATAKPILEVVGLEQSQSNIKRAIKAIDIADRLLSAEIFDNGRGIYHTEVNSQSLDLCEYHVSINLKANVCCCTCPDWQKRAEKDDDGRTISCAKWCKHALALVIHVRDLFKDKHEHEKTGIGSQQSIPTEDEFWNSINSDGTSHYAVEWLES